MRNTAWESRRSGTCAALAVVMGAGIGWLDLHVTEVIVTLVALWLAGLLLGLLQPAAAWRWAVPLALGLPVMAMASRLLGWRTAEPIHPDARVAVVALVASLVGCYSGAAVRRMMGHPRASG